MDSISYENQWKELQVFSQEKSPRMNASAQVATTKYYRLHDLKSGIYTVTVLEDKV